MRFEAEPFGLESDAGEWENETDRGSRAYMTWVRQSLNRIMGLNLAVDGIR